MGLARQQRHLAYGFARRHMGYQLAPAALALDEDAERAGDDQEHGTVVIAMARQFLAARQAEPIGFRQQPAKRRLADIVQQSEALQTRAQRFGKWRVAAVPEGR